MMAAPIGTDRRITALVERYQKSCSTGLATGSGRPSARRSQRRMSSAFSRPPSTTMAAGVTNTAAAAANATVATPE